MPTIGPSATAPIQAPQVPRQTVQYSERQTATTEPVAPVLEATEKKEELLSPKFAALARKEQAFRKREAQLKAREDAIAAREGTPVSTFDSKAFTERMKTDPWATLTEYGLTPDEITQAMLNQPKPEAVAIQKLESKLTEMEKKFSEPNTELEKQQTEAALKQIRYETKILIDSDPTFEMIKTKNASEAVVELIKQSFDESGILMSVAEAAAEVETYLADQAIEEIKATQAIKKIQERLNPQPVQAPQQPLTKQPLKTLTNAVSATSSKPALTDKERVQRAILAFKGQLK